MVSLNVAPKVGRVGTEPVVVPAGLGVGVLPGQAQVLGDRTGDADPSERLVVAGPLDGGAAVGDELRRAETIVLVEVERAAEDERDGPAAEINIIGLRIWGAGRDVAVLDLVAGEVVLVEDRGRRTARQRFQEALAEGIVGVAGDGGCRLLNAAEAGVRQASGLAAARSIVFAESDFGGRVEQRNLGRSGLAVSLVGLGCNNFAGRIDFAATQQVVHKALDLGITLFDNADTYGERGGAEEYLGKILGPRRKDIVLATKFGRPMDPAGKLQGASRRYIMDACNASLRRLRTDYIDLYWQHIEDPRTPIEETLRALDDLVRQGKVRYIACSTLAAWQVVEAQWTARAQGLEHFIACQERYSLLEREYEPNMAAMVEAYGLGLIPFSPLANGLLTGKYRRDRRLPEGARLTTTQRMAERYLTERNWAIVERLAAFAEARGRTMLELAMSWLAARPAVASIIAGATAPEQLEQNVGAVEWALTRQDIDEIDRLAAN